MDGRRKKILAALRQKCERTLRALNGGKDAALLDAVVGLEACCEESRELLTREQQMAVQEG